MSIHAALIANSPRLQCTVGVLADQQWHTTHSIHQVTGSMAVHTDIAEINAPINAGYLVDCRSVGKSENDRSKYEYRLIAMPGKPLEPLHQLAQPCPDCGSFYQRGNACNVCGKNKC